MKDPPESYFRETELRPFSEEERDTFKWRLEALINGVERIKRMAEKEEPGATIRQNRLDLCAQAARLVGDICGDWVKLSEIDAEAPIEYIALSLRIWQPVLAMHDEYDFFWDDVISEIERLPFGDEPEILRPASRSRGVHQQPAKLAFYRLAALRWAAYLKARGIKPSIYRRQISTAFGSDWEAMRKWRSLAARVLGEDYIDLALKLASTGYAMPANSSDYFDALVHVGSIYRELVGLPQASAAVLNEAKTGKHPG